VVISLGAMMVLVSLYCPNGTTALHSRASKLPASP
jgi:hypothetical protein